MNQETNSSQNSHILWLDLLKGMLVFVMILAHCIQFFGDETKLIQGSFSKFANITTFSAFFFVFGVTNAVTNLKKPTKQAFIKIAKSSWRYLFAYYVSAFAYSIFVEDCFFMPRTIRNILSLRELKGYSEFLLAFAAMQLIVFVLYPLWRRMTQRHYMLLVTISILGTLFPYRQNKEPIIGLFIGSEQFYSFPILPYLLYFVGGLWYYNYMQNYVTRNKWVVAIGSVILSVPCYLYIIKNQEIPERFPPKLIFILGAAFIILLYVYLCKRLEQLSGNSFVLRRVIIPLQTMGENSLLFLLLSNLVLFALKGNAFYRQSIGYVITVFLIILYLCFFTIRITAKSTSTKANIVNRIVTRTAIE